VSTSDVLLLLLLLLFWERSRKYVCVTVFILYVLLQKWVKEGGTYTEWMRDCVTKV